MKEKNKEINSIKISLPALSVNEGVARAVLGTVLSFADPTVDELADVRCAVSEAVTNAVVHGYKSRGGVIYISAQTYDDRRFVIKIKDKGCGIPDIKEARQPLFTTDPTGERSGMGFSVMETFMDKVTVRSKVGKGTEVTLVKRLSDK
ncbi:MAG: anti-sigma F factor [Clostridia bacterium]|nr:anti-sigma F factor [Clostridia bacterium]